MADARGPVVVVLAAGAGSRFRTGAATAAHKLAQPFAASTVLGCTLAQVVKSGLPRVVVTTSALHAAAVAAVGERDVLVLPEVGSTDVPLGMGLSIAAGVAAGADAPGWLMLPGDMPLLHAASLRAVAAALHRHAVVHAAHGGRRGHPVGFRAELYGELVALEGDEGARGVLARHAAHAVEVDDPGVLLDIDTEDELDSLRALHAARGGG